MDKYFDAANRYVKTSDWRVIVVLKFCLVSLGVMLGIGVKEEHKKPALIVSGIVFLGTYIPLMMKFFRILEAEDA